MVLLTESNPSYNQEDNSILFNAGRKMSWTSLIVQGKQNRLRCTRDTVCVEWGGRRHTRFLLPGWRRQCWGSSHLCSKEGVLSRVPLPCLPSSLLFTLEDQTFGTVHRREMFTTELCPTLQHPLTMTPNTDSFSSENILHNITFKYYIIIIIPNLYTKCSTAAVQTC